MLEGAVFLFCKILYSNADRLFRFGCSFSHTSSWLHLRLPSGCVFIPSLFSRQQAYPPSHFRFFQRFPAVAPNPFNANLRKKKKQKEERPAADSDTTHQKVTVQANLRAIAALSFGFGITHHFHSFGHDLENKADYASFCKPAEHEHPWWSKGRDRRYRSCARKATAGMTT